MIVRCINTKLAYLGNSLVRDHVGRHIHLEEIGLEEGVSYPVFGLIFRDGHVWYYICDEESAEYPIPYHSAFFENEDACLPDGWMLVDEVPSLVVPPEWAQLPNFLERLVDGDPAAKVQFDTLKQRLGLGGR